MTKSALIIVDVQNDFLPPSGALAVPEGRDIIQPIISLLQDQNFSWDWIIATQDYHPKGHISFASSHASQDAYTTRKMTDGRGKEVELAMWPDHCVIGTKGAEIDKELRGAFNGLKGRMKIARKGYELDVEAYSAFEGYLTEATDPAEPPSTKNTGVPSKDSEVAKFLRSEGVRKVVVVGLATDFCVKSTALSALEAEFSVAILLPLIRGINPESSESALAEFTRHGGTILGSEGSSGDPERWRSELEAWLKAT